MNSIASHHVSALNVAGIAQIVSAANDIALVVDSDGYIKDVTAEQGTESFGDAANWVGKHWADTVTIESRVKIESLLLSTPEQSPSRWRQVNVPSGGDADIAILFRVFSVDETGKKIVMGRDLRALSVMQQELLDVQHSMEDDYARLYQAETRYRMLFQMASEAILIIDSQGRNILEANPAASVFLDQPLKNLISKRFVKYFADKSAEDIEQLLAGVRATGTSADTKVRTRKGANFALNATLVRQDDSSLFLIHLKETVNQGSAVKPKTSSAVMDVIEHSPDAFVVTDPEGRIMTANDAFMELCQVASDLQIENQPLDNWLGRPGVDLGVLRKNMQQRGSVRSYSTQMNPQFGAPIDVELSGVAALQSSTPCLGFIIRRTLRRTKRAEAMVKQPLGRSLEQMTELVGRVPLKDLVKETTDMIERLCIDAALKMTSNNRASAADMLGLSRQSLYVKLRRFGIGESDSDESAKKQ
ncbi:MAG: transcriptional regulator PpsR [Gammaproteobacteria bacterium]